MILLSLGGGAGEEVIGEKGERIKLCKIAKYKTITEVSNTTQGISVNNIVRIVYGVRCALDLLG